MTRARRALGILAGAIAIRAASALAAPPVPPAPSTTAPLPAPASAAPPASAPPPPAPTTPVVASGPASPDTRGAAVRAYHAALTAARLGNAEAESVERLSRVIAAAEAEASAGRRDEAIADLVFAVESSRFAPFAELDEGRAAVFLLGDTLGRAGAEDPARGYLGRLLPRRPPDVWVRRAARSLGAPLTGRQA